MNLILFYTYQTDMFIFKSVKCLNQKLKLLVIFYDGLLKEKRFVLKENKTLGNLILTKKGK